MVGGTIRRKVIHRESFRASVLHLSEIQAVLQSIAEKKSVLTTPSLLSRAPRKYSKMIRADKNTNRAGPQSPARPRPVFTTWVLSSNCELIGRLLSDRPWPVARRLSRHPWRPRRVAGGGWTWSGSGPSRQSVLCSRTDQRWCARLSHRPARN